jgi:hypothetical protein
LSSTTITLAGSASQVAKSAMACGCISPGGRDHLSLRDCVGRRRACDHVSPRTRSGCPRWE